MGQERAGKESRAECDKCQGLSLLGDPDGRSLTCLLAKAASEEVLQMLAAGYSPSQRVK